MENAIVSFVNAFAEGTALADPFIWAPPRLLYTALNYEAVSCTGYSSHGSHGNAAL
jgi:hypothetical protein